VETEFGAESSARGSKPFLLVRRVEPVRQRIRDRGSMGYVVTTFEPSAAVVIIAARVKPALLRVEMVAGSRLGGEQISQ
jgi:hypothetical protein